MIDYSYLASGTDIRARAIGEDATLTLDIAYRVGQAFVVWLAGNVSAGISPLPPKIAIGRDSRLSGEALVEACAQGMASMGADVLDFGMCTTPAMYQCLLEDAPVAQASVMVTASHHPSDRNGMKFFTPSGGITSEQLHALLSLMAEELRPTTRPGAINAYDYLSTYRAALVSVVQTKLDDPVPCPLLGLHVVVDAGNGAGGFYADLLKGMGAWTEGSQYLEPDGRFPNHSPNPEDPHAMQSLSAAVVRQGADLGVMFDADCDRAAIVDASGLAINRNRLIALVSAMLLNQEPGLTIVTDSVTSSGLSRFIGEWGGEHYRYKRGYRNVIDEAKRLNEMGINTPLAIETSGHAALRENNFLDDGMYLSTLLICECMKLKREGKAISSLLEGLQEPVESEEMRLSILAENYRDAGVKLIEAVMDYASDSPHWQVAPDNREGVRINCNLAGGQMNAWFLLRLSVHDPVLPLNIESDIPGGIRSILNELLPIIGEMSEIDISLPKEYLAR